jgi:molybdopterin converting factor small subunit
MSKGKLRVLLFASAREAEGRGELIMEYAEGENLGDLLQRLATEHPKLRAFLRYRFAVDGEYLNESPGNVPLSGQRELAILPPYSGG